MEDHNRYELDKIVTILRKSGKYRVTEKYQKPEFYNQDNPDIHTPKLIGVFLDIEATGLSYTQDKLIELGMVKFEYTGDGRIFRLLEEFSEYQDPGLLIPEYITNLTGITDDMVKDKKIDEIKVINYLQDVSIVIAHNAWFDRVFFEMTFPSIPSKAWGCSMHDVNWKEEAVSSYKLEYIAYKYNFFYEGHRAVIDSLAGIHILAQELSNSRQPVLKQLLTNACKLRFKLWATNSPYDSKESLKARGYRWDNQQANNSGHKAWCIELPEDMIEKEIYYLRADIYGGAAIDIPIEIIDAYSRFSNNNMQAQNAVKYQEKLKWVKSLLVC